MGIQGYISWLKRSGFKFTQEHKIVKHEPKNIYLFYDANSIFYGCMVENDYKKSIQNILDLINQINGKIQDQLTEKQILQIGIFVDGLPPYQKILQGKKRRHMSQFEKVSYSRIIMPGTPFMDQLDGQLRNLPVDFYSGHNEPGEGEHKIFQLIQGNKIKDDNQIIIYGLDTDLLMLSSQYTGITLYRENNAIDVEYYKDYKLKYLNSLHKFNKVPYDQQIIDDIVLIWFLFGNDFLPRLSVLMIDDFCIKKTYREYIKIQNRFGYIRNGQKINQKPFFKLLEYLKSFEDNNLESQLTSDQEFKQSDHQVEIFRNTKTIDEMKFEYYKYYFGKIPIRDVVINYLNTIQWNLLYYHTSSREYGQMNKYIFQHAGTPLICDILRYSKSIRQQQIPFVKERISNDQQQMLVLPKKYQPENIEQMKIQYPKTYKESLKEFQMDTFNKHKDYQFNILDLFIDFDGIESECNE